MKACLVTICFLYVCVFARVPLHAADQKPFPAPAVPKVWWGRPVGLVNMAISPDGAIIATATLFGGNAITLEDRKTGKTIRRFSAGMDLLLFTPDGKRLLTHQGRAKPQGGLDRYEVFVHDIKTGKLVSTFPILPREGLYINQYAVSNKLLVVGSENEVGRVYELESGKTLGAFPGQHRAKAIALSQDGKWLLTAGKDDTLCVWDVGKHELLHKLCDHATKIKAIAISNDGAWCASLTQGNRVWVFDRAKGSECAKTKSRFYPGHEKTLLFTPDGITLIATGEGENHGLFVWDWRKCREMRGGYPRDALLFMTEDPPDKKWHVDSIEKASIATQEGTLLTEGPVGLHLWNLKPPKGMPSP